MENAQASRELFGARVRNYRMRRGWEMEEFAGRVGKSVASISRIETGKQAYVAVGDIQTIARVLGISSALLLDDDEMAESVKQSLDTQALMEACTKKCQKVLTVLSTVIQDLDKIRV